MDISYKEAYDMNREEARRQLINTTWAWEIFPRWLACGIPPATLFVNG